MLFLEFAILSSLDLQLIISLFEFRFFLSIEVLASSLSPVYVSFSLSVHFHVFLALLSKEIYRTFGA